MDIFLGEPPANIKAWIIEHYSPAPAGHPETRITFSDGSSDTYNWYGEIDKQTLIDAGIYNSNEVTWIKEPVTVDIGNTVTSIGMGAFSGCGSLTSVTFCDGVESIETEAFYGCDALESVTFPDSVTSIEWNSFDSCYNLYSVTIGSGITSIGGYAFYNCYNLTEVTIDKTKSEVEEMEYDSWGVGAAYDGTFPAIIHCSDNQDIAIS